LLATGAHPLLDFRHRPQSIVDADSLLLVIISKHSADLEGRMVADTHDLGASTFVFGDRADTNLRGIMDKLFNVDTG
jgi:fructoselysine-6-P-deglycase FrlB-like protein